MGLGIHFGLAGWSVGDFARMKWRDNIIRVILQDPMRAKAVNLGAFLASVSSGAFHVFVRRPQKVVH